MATASFSTLIRNFVLGEDYFIRLYDEGLEISREQTDMVPWSELQALVIGENQNSFELILRDGRKLVITKPPRNSKHYEWQRGYEDAKLDIDYQLVRRALPDLVRRLGEGQPLEFGPLKITQAGLQVAENRLAWDKFSTLAFDFPRIGKKNSNPTPVQFYQHDTPRLWQALAWQDIPNLAVLFNLLEQVTSLRLWENQWDVASAQRFVQDETGIHRTLKFQDDGQRKQDIHSTLGCSRTMLLMTLALIIAVPVLFILDSDLVTPNTGSSWFQALCCLLPGGLFMFFHERREAIRDFHRSTKVVEITPERVRVMTNEGKEINVPWHDIKTVEGVTWFDGETWLLGAGIFPNVYLNDSVDEADDDVVLEFDHRLSPEVKMLVEKAGQRVLIPQKVAQVVAGREIMGEGWKRFYTVNQKGLRRDEQFVSWDELRAKVTPYAIILPEWAYLMYSDPLASAVAAVARHYIYESK